MWLSNARTIFCLLFFRLYLFKIIIFLNYIYYIKIKRMHGQVETIFKNIEKMFSDQEILLMSFRLPDLYSLQHVKKKNSDVDSLKNEKAFFTTVSKHREMC